MNPSTGLAYTTFQQNNACNIPRSLGFCNVYSIRFVREASTRSSMSDAQDTNRYSSGDAVIFRVNAIQALRPIVEFPHAPGNDGLRICDVPAIQLREVLL